MTNFVKIEGIQFMHRKRNQSSSQTKEIDQSIYQIDTSEVIFVSIDISISKDWKEDLILLPSNYILCNDKPLIADTLRINLK
jgi:hypothetical protein